MKLKERQTRCKCKEKEVSLKFAQIIQSVLELRKLPYVTTLLWSLTVSKTMDSLVFVRW